MRSWPERRRKQARIEIIPMIDVMMFLLVFFVLISTNVLPALGLNVTLPHSAATEKVQDRRKVTLTLDRQGQVYLDGQAVELSALSDRLRAIVAESPTLPAVIIAGDGAAELQRVVDVLDAVKGAGVVNASIIARPK